MNRYLIRLGVIVVGFSLLFAVAAFGSRKVECVGNLCITDDGGISPSKLPRHESVPITARITGGIATRDGGHPPALRSVDLDIDKTIQIDAVGIPTCKAGQLRASDTASVKRVCGDAIVGSGRAEVEVSFPEQAPFSATGPVVLFNGGVQGRVTTVFVHTYVNVPAPTAVVTKATVTRIHRGRFGLHIAAKVPAIAGGAGSVTKFDLEVGRKFTYKGHKKSFLVASCPTGSWAAMGNVLFDDGTRLGLTHVFPCTPED